MVANKNNLRNRLKIKISPVGLHFAGDGMLCLV
jgi:hypothetical protein